jgi:hypothetical protein
MHLYANAATGNDANDGLTPATPKLTLQAVFNLVPYQVRHDVIIHLSGQFVIPHDTSFQKRMFDFATLTIDGGDQVTVVADNAGSPWAADIHLDGYIGLSSLTWTPEFYTGYMVQILTGPAAGDIRTIKSNTATTLVPTIAFSADPGVGATFRIVRPATTIEQTGIPFDVEQHTHGDWTFDGTGYVNIQRLTFTGTAPLNFHGGYGGEIRLSLSAVVIDKMTIWRVGFIFQRGLFGLNTDVHDPAVFGNTTLLANNKCGFGSVGGDGSIFVFDVLVEFATGDFSCTGSLVQYALLNESSVRIVGDYSRVKQMVLLQSRTYGALPASNMEFGGFVPFGYPGPGLPSISMMESSLYLNNCSFSSPLDSYGVAMRGSVIRFDGTITGTCANAGVYAYDLSKVYLESGAVSISLTGSGIGDLTWDGVTPVVGGWASILGGALVTDAGSFNVARIRAAQSAL